MTSKEIRNAFFDFFKEKDHQWVKSAPIVIKDDPTLMFTNAGMNQFKEYFLGNKKSKYPRIVDTQKCLRVSGKHNDLEEVGVDTYHHTMFEMLGNWSFGNFFKAEIIPWAWEFLTDKLGLDKERLYVTIFEGDQEDGLDTDQEAYDAWAKIIPQERILKASKKENFWEMGEVGPCGPCSEIHMDMRSKDERKKLDGKTLVNQDHPQVVEIWNLVFMEFNRLKDKSLQALPDKHVDTGMGLERLCMAIQEKSSTYDTDLFASALIKLEGLTGMQYEATDSKKDIAFRVIVDHIRAIAFSIADGQLPSNTGAGYVIRRILRRAVRYGYSFLNLKEAFLYELIDPLTDTLGDSFEELVQQKEIIVKVIQEEEKSFLKTLDKGIQLFDHKVKGANKTIDGNFAFELYDTYGFPIDLTELLAKEKALEVDMPAFEKALKAQKDRSRKAGKIETSDWVEIFKDKEEEFIGYDRLEANVKVSRYRQIEQKGKSYFQLVFNLTPFYPEGGGQVGDQGRIQSKEGEFKVVDTKKENNLIVHYLEQLPNDIEADFHAEVYAKNRQSTASNHTATHLLHEALREVLGTHVEQKGSLVHPDYLRFDFSHFQKVNAEEIAKIEALVNQRVRENHNLAEFRNIPMEEAKQKGAMALFGEKYGDTVRMIQFGESKELCGGTHLKATGEIGVFKITSESAVAAGIRRIEAISAEKAYQYQLKQEALIEALKQELKNPKDLKQALASLVKENQKLQKELEAFKQDASKNVKKDLLDNVEEKGGVNQLIAEVDLDANSIKNLAFQLKAELENLFLVLVSKHEGKANITIAISETLVKEKDLHAGNLVRDLAKHIQGGGGGQAFFATAGGKNVEGIDNVINAAKTIIS